MVTVNALVVSALLLSGAAQAQSGERNAIDMKDVSESHVAILDVSKSGQPGKSFMAATVINAPLPKLCSIIMNFADYPSFMPNVEKAALVHGTDGAPLVDMTLKLPLGKIKKYRLKMTPDTGPTSCRLSWKLVPSKGLTQEETITDTTGYWELVPHAPDKTKTMVRYFVHTDPGPVPMGFGWIVDSLSKDSIPKTLEMLRSKGASR